MTVTVEAAVCGHLDVPEIPSIVQLRNVLHLGSLIEGRLREPAPTVLELARLLHPTPPRPWAVLPARPRSP